MKSTAFTTEQLADRFFDVREIENVMGRFVNSLLLKRDDEIYERYFSRFEDDICYGTNDGWYYGRDAVKAFFAGRYADTQARSEFVQKMFPDFLGEKVEEEIHGVGEMQEDAITPPVLELSGYGTTAKGVWLFNCANHQILSCGPYTTLENGYYAVDFTKEGTSWKIWHMQRIVVTKAPQELDWAHDDWKLPVDKPEFAALASLDLIPSPNMPEEISPIYSAGGKVPAKIRVPAPFYDWSETFSYGPAAGKAPAGRM